MTSRANLEAIIKEAIAYTREHPEMTPEQILGVFTNVFDTLERLPDDELDKLAGRRRRRWFELWRI